MEISYCYNRKLNGVTGLRFSLEFVSIKSQPSLFEIMGLIYDRAPMYNFEIIEICYDAPSNKLRILLECSLLKDNNMVMLAEHDTVLINEMSILDNVDIFMDNIIKCLKMNDIESGCRRYWTATVEREWKSASKSSASMEK